MSDLWQVIGELSVEMHQNRVEAVADTFERIKTVDEFWKVKDSFGPNFDQERVVRLETAWIQEEVDPKLIACAFRASSCAAAFAAADEKMELVWTGPKSRFIPSRNTEQTMLQVIDSAVEELFMVSYVFSHVDRIIDSLNAAVQRGVQVKILLESSKDHGGSISIDSVHRMVDQVRGAKIYIWGQVSRESFGGGLSAAVHGKCAVADGKMAFITSANLTSAAMERNMELGIRIQGGVLPERLHKHLNSLVMLDVVSEWMEQ